MLGRAELGGRFQVAFVAALAPRRRSEPFRMRVAKRPVTSAVLMFLLHRDLGPANPTRPLSRREKRGVGSCRAMPRRTVAIDPTRDALRAQLAFTSMERARYDVDGRTVLITGGARGIGLASARLLAQRGARLALLDIDDDELERQATPLNAAWAGCDVTDPGAVSAAVDDIVDRLGGIDVVFANAGVEPRVATVLSADPEAWRLVVDVNLHAALVERTFAQPAVDRLRKALPAFFTSPIAVERAAAAIVD
jgi:short chain dehydrogenase